jgi:hypothetical protein
MDSIDNPKDEVMHRLYFLDSEPMIVSMMSHDLRLGAFAMESIETPSLDPFLPWLSFL